MKKKIREYMPEIPLSWPCNSSVLPPMKGEVLLASRERMGFRLLVKALSAEFLIKDRCNKGNLQSIRSS